jgi:glycosyltransferase involved in cell wall biosynthesis
MVPPLRKAFSDLAEIQEIRFGIDDAFFNLQRRISRRPRIWVTVCRVTRAKIGPLFDWGENLFSEDEELHLIGPNTENLTLPPWVRYHGPTDLNALRSEWLPRASALVTLSTHSEGLPQIILEAMASGVPVIASPLAAHREMISHDENGCLVDSADGLHRAVDRLSAVERNLDLGAAARARVLEVCGTWRDVAARYHAAYQRLLQG